MDQVQSELLPMVSVGMPVYNGGEYIREALDSVLAQTFTDFELIISDNASDDDTQAICDEYCKKDLRIKYVRHNENLGGHWNFTFVTKNAKGKYITWLAHDDIIEPGFIEETVQCMSQQPGAVLVSSDFEIIDQNGNTIRVENLTTIRVHIDWKKRCIDFFKHPNSNVFFCIYGLMRTDTCNSVLQLVSEPKVAAGSELPVLARFAVVGEIASIPIVLRKYRMHPTSVFSSERDAISKLSRWRQQSIQIANLFRLRSDQLTVLWSSTLSPGFKSVISIKVLFFYLKHSISWLLRMPFRIIRFLHSRIMSRIRNSRFFI